MNRKVTVVLERDSVCAADDCDAPHAKSEVFDATSSVGEVMKKLRSLYRLPLIAGGRATWVAFTSRPLALIAQEWKEERFFVDPSAVFFDHLIGSGAKIRFRYFAQESPDEVFEREEKVWANQALDRTRLARPEIPGSPPQT